MKILDIIKLNQSKYEAMYKYCNAPKGELRLYLQKSIAERFLSRIVFNLMIKNVFEIKIDYSTQEIILYVAKKTN